MTTSIENMSISMGLTNRRAFNLSDAEILIQSMEDVVTPAVLLPPKYLQILICIVGWIMTCIGSYFRIIIYKYIYNQYKLKEVTPINVLTFCSCFVTQVTVIFNIIYETMVVANNSNIVELTGPAFCSVVRFLSMFELYYSIICGVGIAFYRILLIKLDLWVKNRLGEATLLNSIFFVGMLICCSIIAIKYSLDSYHLADRNCMIAPGKYLLTILDEHQQSLGEFPTYQYLIQFRKLAMFIMILMTVMEIAIYISFFHHMYMHDNTERLEKLLGTTTIKARNRKNALTFMSQFCSFVFEVTIFLVLFIAALYGEKGKPLYLMVVFLKKVSFASIAVIEVLVSRNNLRWNMFKTT